ncbi:GntR family transcriptional regulator [uncultured Aeromicrobium sp.]|uniref:GntR family transcriptional regulator n=1 Tax=uncultured Aeromicrobium sp. TaxID=337820 RepID=UPI0025E29951|nr:GntR family transcriptional regulator [uncultured Aeromicrobium sp.]
MLNHQDDSRPGRIAQQLREEILIGEIMPGTRLKDQALAERFDISRNTVREALGQLARDGLVVYRRNAGCAVRILTEEDARDIYRVRRSIEAAGVDASTAVGPTTLDQLRRQLAVSAAAIQQEQWTQLDTSSLRIHQHLVGFIGSPRLDAFFATILAQLRLVFAVMPDEVAHQREWFSRDTELVEDLLSGRRRQAHGVLLQYLEDSERQIIDAIRAQQGR